MVSGSIEASLRETMKLALEIRKKAMEAQVHILHTPSHQPLYACSCARPPGLLVFLWLTWMKDDDEEDWSDSDEDDWFDEEDEQELQELLAA